MLSRNSATSAVMSFILTTMLCVVSAISAVRLDIRVMVSMVFCISSACTNMSAIRSCMYFWFSCCGVPCMLIWNGI